MDSGVYPQGLQVPSSNCYPCKFTGVSNSSAIALHVRATPQSSPLLTRLQVGSFFTATFYYSEMKDVKKNFLWEDVFNLTFFANGTDSLPAELEYMADVVAPVVDLNQTNSSSEALPPPPPPPEALVVKVGHVPDSLSYPCQFGVENDTQPLGVNEFLFHRPADGWKDFAGEWEGQTFADGHRDGLFDNLGRVRCGEVGFIIQHNQVSQPGHCMTLCVQERTCLFASYNAKFSTCILLSSCLKGASISPLDPVVYGKKEAIHNLLCQLKVIVVGLQISVHVHGCDGKEDGVRRSAHEGWSTGYIFPLPVSKEGDLRERGGGTGRERMGNWIGWTGRGRG
eukprot:495961-Hanusia_phi.AAC.1